jgi:hypothetical protein
MKSHRELSSFFSFFLICIEYEIKSLKAIDLSDKPHDVNIEDYNLHKIDPQVLINRISVRVETLANSAKDLAKLIDVCMLFVSLSSCLFICGFCRVRSFLC